MANGKATASFFENGSTTQFEYCYKLYPEVLKMKAEKRSKKPQELIRLDQWFQNELPTLIKARGKDAHLVYDELVQAMKWKQSRGKFYPQLSYLVKVNTPRAVIQETKKAFRKLPNLEQAITALSNLKGVGTTMASALLTAAAPDSAPFMADECLMAIPEIEGIDYTTKEYLNFVQHIQSTVERLNAEVGGETPHWSPHRVELALWAHYVANDLSPELLDEMPPPGVAATAMATNGKTTSSKVLDGDDTNDGVGVVDDESLGAAADDNINPPLATSVNVVGAKNNSNSNNNALQDGDSNFVSNDSTSQEPIIDDNTTQTTATTTSTEDGEDRGPLASDDSESNLEAPPQQQQQQHKNHPQPAAAGVAAEVSPQQQQLNNNKQLNNNGETVATTTTTTTTAAPASVVDGAAAADGVGAAPPPANGNGKAAAASATTAQDEDELDDDDVDDEDEEDDEEEDDEDDEDEELEADESNSSSNNLRASRKQLQQHLTTTASAAAATDSATLTAPSIGQKRTALHCELDASSPDGATAAAATGADKSPELKKLRSD
ncbi:uncharacterized protein LOC133848971 [Drosophila sulfurigaster albostrigata]|uniref:uncharacterized protein LOC133848971 n=1 Tax=Drosophila sulfurigaster albostrigata TaxID=89887 RepID=UPI002D21BD5E|nr:uncharacterized protein LOC133848971 [Drosophila sulfurigaster albostrigata]XP_062140734.1 uncharacterized protein LOC133848971 [Drosophila sulfurigaster albostrigata]XP_062140735.1 uncharacterized protein LOC133848971 [Drosophila sulfurigaster albostrigata]